MVLPLDEVVIFALLTLDCCDDTLHPVEEYRAHAGLGLQLVDHEPPLVFCPVRFLLYVVEKRPAFHVLWVRATLDLFADDRFTLTFGARVLSSILL